jgi:hypothetical protein
LGADRELGFCVSWTAELRQAFARLLAGERPQVSFFQNQTTAGEIGAEFNALVGDMERMKNHGASRDDVHRARNRLAGILAALQVMAEVGELPGEEKATISVVMEDAKKLDGQLRHS